MLNDTIVHLTAEGTDERSGVWKYTWYVQAGTNAPWWKECETDSASFDYHVYDGIDYGFCVLAIDSAGNVEQKVTKRERGFISIANNGDANCNGEVEIGDVTSVLTLMATPEAIGYNRKAADANANGEIEIGDVTTILTIMAGGDDVTIIVRWRMDFGQNSYLILTFNQDGTVKYQEYDNDVWKEKGPFNYSYVDGVMYWTYPDGRKKRDL
jgi:hypothetical protein